MKAAAKDILRIALIGPESTGKTTLCNELAAHYGTLWIPELARGMAERLGRQYTLEDIVDTARRQMKAEAQALSKARRLLFADTECIVARVWCLEKFGECPAWIEEQIDAWPYDLYLLTAPDLPWEPDPVRENKQARHRLFGRYRQELVSRKLPFETVRGAGRRRFHTARAFVDQILIAR
jgi:NadR type nicotinamide-nucleotide adenylyltransferase